MSFSRMWRLEIAPAETSVCYFFCMIATLPLLLFQAPVWPGDDLGCIKTVPAQLEDTVTSMKYLDRDISFFPTSHLQCRHKGQHRRERV